MHIQYTSWIDAGINRHIWINSEGISFDRIVIADAPSADGNVERKSIHIPRPNQEQIRNMQLQASWLCPENVYGFALEVSICPRCSMVGAQRLDSVARSVRAMQRNRRPQDYSIKHSTASIKFTIESDLSLYVPHQIMLMLSANFCRAFSRRGKMLPGSWICFFECSPKLVYVQWKMWPYVTPLCMQQQIT
jgi:hypothetical protein